MRGLLDLERSIRRDDQATTLARWEYGRELIGDDELMTPGGDLRPGADIHLIGIAAAQGRRLDVAEIHRRIECARAYPTKDEIGNAVADFGSWLDLAEAGFPPLASDAGATIHELRRTTK